MQILRDWLATVRVGHKAHIKSAARLERNNLLLGVPATILSAVVGTAVFASWETGSGFWRILFGLLSIAAAVFASLQTRLKYAEVAELHRKAAGRYSKVRRRIEELLATYTDENPCESEPVKAIGDEWAAIEGSSPSLDQSLYEKVRAQVARETKAKEKVGAQKA